MTRTFIGIDVCKDYLDAADRPGNSTRRFTNDSDGIAELILWAQPLNPERIILESTGPYQKAAVGAMLAAGLPAVVVNARQVRDFAKGMGQLAKTDIIDARILALFGEHVPTTVRPLPAPDIQEFQAFYDRRSQLVKMLAMEKNHRHSHGDGSPKILKSIKEVIAHLEKQIKKLEDLMDLFVANCDAFRAKDEVLQSIPGIGPQVSRTLLAYLPELGTGTRQTIAALVGLAPYAEDSGSKKGQRHIRGGRSKVRIGLYQAAVVAIRWFPAMKTFYAGLKARGKASKVALVAVARKILVLANALIRKMTPYKEPANSVSTETA